MDNDFSGIQKEARLEMYPNGLSGIAISFGNPYRYENDIQENNFDSGMVAIGLHSKVFSIIPNKIQKHFIISLKPGVLPKFLKTSMNELHNQVIDLECFMKNEKTIAERLAAAENPYQCVEIVEEWLLRKVQNIEFCKGITHAVLSDILDYSGDIKIKELCYKYRINKKYIERQFKEHIGITPKQYSEIVKLTSLINLLMSSYEKQWQDICAEAAFTDYSHLRKHTGKLTKQSPQMLRQKLYESHSNGAMSNVNDMLSSLCILDKPAILT